MDDKHICDEYGRTWPLTQLQITTGGERTVCSACLTIEIELSSEPLFVSNFV